MKNKECNLVKDLLPNYIDKVTSNETNVFIEEHLKNCDECRESFKNMSEEIKVDYKNNENKKINIFKKVNNKIKLLKTIIFVIIFLFIVIFIRKVAILYKVENMAIKADYKNYSKIRVETTENCTIKKEYYQHNDNFVAITTRIDEEGVEEMIEYQLNGIKDRRSFKNKVENKDVNKDKNSIREDVRYQFLNKSFWGNIGVASIDSIKSVELGHKDCYLLVGDDYLNFIDKETGLTIKDVNFHNNFVIDYKYTFGDVTNEKIENLINDFQS